MSSMGATFFLHIGSQDGTYGLQASTKFLERVIKILLMKCTVF